MARAQQVRVLVTSPEGAKLALNAEVDRLSARLRVPIRVQRGQESLPSQDSRTWEWSGHPDQYSIYAIYELRPGLVKAEGRAVLEAIERLAKDAKEAGKDVILAVSHPWPVGAAVMIARRKLGDKKAHVVDWTSRALALFTFEDDKLVGVSIRAPQLPRPQVFRRFVPR